ncbi:acyl carrier protein [Paenibacillus sp. sptzw28]|uniref:phosphopantetheine-binding protein n=1 Tax=Paenibacillus sp. sptzw28 TaxID=715179 RepID=UPI001C6E2ACE|nr:phosphopantetheine-binding protein [Paenibacillus sp. sptzw28]QYR19393.1 acyl carrier protein [Paenibacillus sp. sptzw28]
MEQKQEIMNELRTLMVENLELRVREPLEESDRLYEDLHIDSIMVLQLTVYIEETFKVYVPEEGIDPDTFLTVGSLVDFIINLQKTAV